jgi:hypothetical protein
MRTSCELIPWFTDLMLLVLIVLTIMVGPG